MSMDGYSNNDLLREDQEALELRIEEAEDLIQLIKERLIDIDFEINEILKSIDKL